MVQTRAGERIAAALPQGPEGPAYRTAAGIVVDGEHPGLPAEERRQRIEWWRRYFQRWTKKPVAYINAENAAIVERYFDVPAEELTRRMLTEEERRLQEAARLEAKARKLREELSGR